MLQQSATATGKVSIFDASVIIQDAISVKARPQPFSAMTLGKTTMPTAMGQLLEAQWQSWRNLPCLHQCIQ